MDFTKGGLWFSIIFRPKLKLHETVKLVFLACLAVAETIRDMYGLKAETKWQTTFLLMVGRFAVSSQK